MKTKILTIILTAAVFMGIFPSFSISAAGTDEVYHIYSIIDMLMVAEHPDANYILENDIDISEFGSGLAALTIRPEVTVGTAEKPFTGSFDGNGFTIVSYYAPFRYIGESGIVKNLAVKYVRNSYHESETGGIADNNAGTISGCFSFSDNTNYKTEGGIAFINTGRIVNCYSNCYNLRSSIAVTNSGTIENCYSPQSDQPLAENNSGKIINCFASNANTFGVKQGPDPVTLLKEEQMNQANSFTGWDFDSVWTTCGDVTQPMLRKISGSGTAEDPYKLHSQNLLSLLGCGESGKGKYFIAALGGTHPSRVGSDENPFTGIYDAKNIGYYNSAPFNVIGSEGIVQNIGAVLTFTIIKNDSLGGIANKNYGTIRNCYVNINASNGNYNDVGGIAGENIYGTIENCIVQGSISVSGTGIGGIVGYNKGGTIRCCAALLKSVKSNKRTVGGITGDTTEGLIENCFSQINGVSSTVSEAGGITGRLFNGTVKNCYSVVSSISAPEYAGGIVGNIIENGSTEDCYFYNEKIKNGIGSDRGELYYAEPDAMKTRELFANWDFSNVWFLDGDYPELIAVSGNGTKDFPYIIRDSKDWNAKAPKSLQSTGNRLFYKLSPLSSNYFNGHNTYGTEADPFIGSIDGQGTILSSQGLIDVLGNDGYIFNTHYKAADKSFIKTNYGTLESCFSIESSLTNINDGGVIQNCFSYRNHLVMTNRNGGIIQNCAAFYSPILFADINNNAVIENCYALSNGDNGTFFFVRKNDNNGIIKNSVLSAFTNSSFCEENYAGISDCGIIFNNAPLSEALFSFKNSGTITNCRTVSADTEEIPFIKEGSGDVSFADSIEIPMILTYSSPNGTQSDYTAEQNPAPLYDISGHWAEQIILELYEAKIISGYDDGTFRPDNPVTKGEFLKLMLEAANISPDGTESPYTDANQHWAAQYVNTAFRNELTQNIAISETEFGADIPITRLQAAVMVGRLLKPEGGTAEFTDSGNIPEWGKSAVGAAAELGIITGMPDGSFLPYDNLTRAQAAAIVLRIKWNF